MYTLAACNAGTEGVYLRITGSSKLESLKALTETLAGNFDLLCKDNGEPVSTYVILNSITGEIMHVFTDNAWVSVNNFISINS